jgi:hypothetical protein
MKISFAITVCNEYHEIISLVERIKKYMHADSEIVVLVDYSKVTTQLLSLLHYWRDVNLITLGGGIFNNDFAEWKNKLSEISSGEYIFQIDADELPNQSLILNLPSIISTNSQFDVFLVPRINTVSGIEPKDISKWNWVINDKGWINFPDYQWRIYRNHSSIFWVNKVHERLEGFSSITRLPEEEEYTLLHNKSIEKQRSQNEFYYLLQHTSKE